MSQDPYTPPSAPVRDRQPEAAGSTWKAVSLGVLADIVGTFLAGILLMVVMGAVMVSRGATPEEIDRTLLQSDAYLLFAGAIGLGFTVLGGFIAARVANQREYYHGLLTGIVVLVIGELMSSYSPADYPLAYRIIGDLLVIPAAMFGAHLRKAGRLRG